MPYSNEVGLLANSVSSLIKSKSKRYTVSLANEFSYLCIEK